MNKTTINSEGEYLNLPNSDITYFPSFLSKETASRYFILLLNGLKWQQHQVKLYGKTLPQPRLTALYAQNETPYKYSGLSLTPSKLTPPLLELQEKLKNLTGKNFTHCLANLYRDGNDSMGLHADDEIELGKNPVIASLSFGAARKFRLKHKFENLKCDLVLESGSLLLMQGTTQHYWKHELPKTKKEVSPRVNLTFRIIS